VSLAVVDASVLTAFYAADDPRRGAVVARLAVGDVLVAPAHLDAEVVSALRRLASRHLVLREMVPAALGHLSGFAIRRLPLALLLERMWELRDNVTPYDAAYVAVAERLEAPLITCDGKLAAASGPRCAFELIQEEADHHAASSPRP
jgi:predicted nucleic acid-binding protein